MSKRNRYSLQNLKKDFVDDNACIQYIFDALHSRDCECKGEYRPMKNGNRPLRTFQCSKCRAKISPTASTIFHKSDTPLTLWFHAIFVFAHAKSGISAKQMQRHLGVTYKCAYRILSLIRQALKQSDHLLQGTVETDAGFFGGVFKSGKGSKLSKEAIAAKTRVMIAIERNGEVRAKVAPDVTAQTSEHFVRSHVKPKSFLFSDATSALNRVEGDYERHTVNHSKDEYVRGTIHTNNVNNWIAHVKRSIRGTFKSVSPEKLQEYLDSFAFHYNMRGNDKRRFEVLLGMLLRPSR